MTRLHKLELALARAKNARGKLRNARPYGEVEPEWDDAERYLDQALNTIEMLIVWQKQWMKETADAQA
jgi:hypothetical protein